MRIVYTAPKGKAPDDQTASPITLASAPTPIGQTATNEATNEKWFVNKSQQWQQLIKA